MPSHNTPDNTEAFLSSVAEAISDEAAQSSVLKLVDEFLKQQTGGLKAKNADLISENKKLKSSVPDGLDSESIKAMLSELKGKTLDDYGNSIREETASKLNTLQGKLTESATRAQALDRQYQSTLINLELRATAEKAGVRPDAIGDFVSIHSKNFELKEGQAVSGETSPTDYVAGVLQKSDYWYPASVGAGANGSRSSRSGLARDPDLALTSAAQSGDQATYRKLRKEQKA